MLKHLTGGPLSAVGIRRILARQAAQLLLPKPRPGQIVLVDATKAKAGAKDQSEPVYLAVTAEPGPLRNQRLSCRKHLVHLHVGDSRHLKRQLKTMRSTHVLHDGGEDLAGCAPNVQRAAGICVVSSGITYGKTVSRTPCGAHSRKR